MMEPRKPLSAWIGRTIEAEDLLTHRLDASFRATFGRHLVATEEGVAPLGLHWCLAPEIAGASRLGSDGQPSRGDFLPPVPLPRRMWAGGEVQIVAQLRIGDRVRRHSTVDSLNWKQGNTGSLCFVNIRHQIDSAAGPAIKELQTLVYREASPAKAGARPDPTAEPPSPPDGQARPVQIDEVLLFRYSALTFNGHRIHYDAPYSTNVEGYAGLIVHGPLQATLLLNHAARLYGRAPSHFTFRSVSAAAGTQTLRLIATTAEANTLDLRIESSSGAVTMRATARWH